MLREPRATLPSQRFVYVAGDCNDAALTDHLIKRIGRLIDIQAPAIFVMACNKAATLALAALRAAYPAVAFTGTVPVIKPAAEQTRPSLISVLDTSATVRRGYTRDLRDAYAAKCETTFVGRTRLATMTEHDL